MLGNKYWVIAQWRLLAIVGGIGSGQSAIDEVGCVLQNDRHSFALQVVPFPIAEVELLPKG